MAGLCLENPTILGWVAVLAWNPTPTNLTESHYSFSSLFADLCHFSSCIVDLLKYLADLARLQTILQDLDWKSQLCLVDASKFKEVSTNLAVVAVDDLYSRGCEQVIWSQTHHNRVGCRFDPKPDTAHWILLSACLHLTFKIEAGWNEQRTV